MTMKSTGITKKVVRVISVDPRYRKSPYPAVAVLDERANTYITGQHINPEDPSTIGNLTIKEMIGEVDLSEDKKKKFPYIINPENPVPIIHLKRLNLSRYEDGSYVAPKDKALYDFYQLQRRVVAPSKDKVKKGTHYFYIEDKEQEARQYVTKKDTIFKAQKLVREQTAARSLVDVALFLNYSVPGFNVNVDVLTKLQLEEKILVACEKHPYDVIKSYSKDSKQILYILKLETNKIIQRKEGNFFDGGRFLGATVEEVIRFMDRKENETFVTKWAKQYHDKVKTLPDDIPETSVEGVDEEKAKEKAILENQVKVRNAKRGQLKSRMSRTKDDDKLIAIAIENGVTEAHAQKLFEGAGRDLLIDFTVNLI